jgi:Rhs element Vgr protein
MTASGIQSGGIATFSILVNGNMIPDELSALSVTVKNKLNTISSATITILDGEADTQAFAVSSSATFVPGNTITIKAGYDGNNKVIFTGIITGQSISINDQIGSSLEVECRDEAVKMVSGRKSKIFKAMKDSDIISSIISSYNGLSASVTTTEITVHEQVQYYVTDWDFILAMAESNGMMVKTQNNVVSVFKPDANTSPVLSVSYGEGLMEFNASLDAMTQTGGIKATAWDYKTQARATAEVKNSYSGPGNLSSATLASVPGNTNYGLSAPAPLNEQLAGWCNAQLVKSNYAKIQGTAKFQGTALAETGKYITMGGLSDRFNGDHLISFVEHEISEGNWITKIYLGLPPEWHTAQPEVAAPQASGLIPGIKGLVSGIVVKAYEDPDSQYRVQVHIPTIDENVYVWARLANFYATAGAGAFFYPEAGDEVIIGFINEDPRFPVILGSLYSSPSKRPGSGLEPSETNAVKSIVSRSGINISFNDENKIITVATPAGNTFILSDKDKMMSMADQNGNSIIMSENGISIKSSTDIKIEAPQNLSLTGSTGIQAKSVAGDVRVSGMNIRETAQMEYSAEGSLTAKVTAGMEVTLKGAMIMIN